MTALFFDFGFAAMRLAGPYSRSVSAATVASATAVRNARRKCGVGSDTTPTVATSKVNWGGIPLALPAALSRAGVATFSDRSRYRADHFAGASSEGDRMPVPDLWSPQSLD